MIRNKLFFKTILQLKFVCCKLLFFQANKIYFTRPFVNVKTVKSSFDPDFVLFSVMWGPFHHHFKSSFFRLQIPKAQNRLITLLNFYAFWIFGIKAVHKMLMKSTCGGQFYNHLKSSF